MYCMNCGQSLPDTAKFCMKCGTPQNSASSMESSNSVTVNTDALKSFVPAMCPNCNAHMKVDVSSKISRCEACGTECLVQDAIKTLNVRGNVQVGNATINVYGTNIDNLLQRVELMLADGDYRGAVSRCETILDSDPSNGNAYLYLLMANLECRRRSELASQRLFDQNKYFVKAIQFGDENLKTELQGYIKAIHSRCRNPHKGDEIYFGSINGQRIWWKVLDVRDNMACLLCSSSVACMPYHARGGSISWSKCSLRTWLNNDFINQYFTPEEREKILMCNNVTDRRNQVGDSTSDKVFLLSIDEAGYLFDSTRAICSAWWLRSPGITVRNGGINTYRASFVDFQGRIDSMGSFIYDDRIGVRPVMWVRIVPT